MIIKACDFGYASLSMPIEPNGLKFDKKLWKLFEIVNRGLRITASVNVYKEFEL